jgi:GT2 family glycosyltransferase
MPGQTPTSIIICAYTEARWNDLVEAIASVQQQTLPSAEIIIVIDHNKLLFQRACESLHDVKVIENCETRGLSGARNSGIAEAKGEIIAFLDEDAVSDRDWLANLVSGFTHPDVLGVGGEIIPMWVLTKPTWMPSEFYWVVGCSYKGLPESPEPVRNLIGCNMAFRKEVFQTVGAFRNDMGRVGTLPVGCEETELCIRAQQHYDRGFFLYQPKARVQHRVPPSRLRWKYFLSRCYSEGISKAQVSHFTGSAKGLSSERTYTLRTLPAGFVHGIKEGIFNRNLGGFLRSVAILIGFTFTTLGFIYGVLFWRSAESNRNESKLRPTFVIGGKN